jgi:hypothetical protein
MRQKLLILFISFYTVGCLCPRKNKIGTYEVDIISFTEAKFYSIYTAYNSSIDYNSHYVIPVTTDKISNIDTLGISFDFNITSRLLVANSRGFNLINTAYACSRPSRDYVPKTKIDSIIITSDTIYNGINPGASLNALFKSSLTNGYGNYLDVNNLIANLNSSINSSYIMYSQMFFITDIKPDFNTKHRLFIKIYKANNEVIEGETIPFAWI